MPGDCACASAGVARAAAINAKSCRRSVFMMGLEAGGFAYHSAIGPGNRDAIRDGWGAIRDGIGQPRRRPPGAAADNRARDYIPKTAVDPGRIAGMSEIIVDAVQLSFI